MIIAWKWHDFSNYTLTEDWFQKEANQGWWDNRKIEEAKELLFDEYKVKEKKEEVIKSEKYQAIVVRLRLKYNSYDKLSLVFMLRLIDYYETEGAEIQVFLHRRDGFDKMAVRRLLDENSKPRYFLFGGGRDFIYYNTFNVGLLGDDEQFYSQIPNGKQPAIRVADDENKYVFQPHFNKAWTHYEHEFETKIFELKEDLLSHFFLLYDQFGKPYSNFLEHLEENKPLLWRVKSFMDDSCNCFEEEEIKKLEKYGYEHQKSYIFDDCGANLSRLKNVDKEYMDVAGLLNKLLYESQRNGETLQEKLNTLNKKFEELLAVLN